MLNHIYGNNGGIATVDLNLDITVLEPMIFKSIPPSPTS